MDFSPFDSKKWLTHYEDLSKLPRGETVHPWAISLDPAAICDLSCSFCNSTPILDGSVYDRIMIDKITALCETWHVKTACIGGGGEPTLCKDLGYLIDSLYFLSVKMGMVTSGQHLDKHLSSLHKLSWIGISVDAGCSDTYLLVKGGTGQQWLHLLDNIQTATHLPDAPLIEYKFLVTVDNYREVYRACEVARGLMCDCVHIRPGTTPTYQHEVTDFGYTHELHQSVLTQVSKARVDLESDDFKIHCITDKYAPGFLTHNPFKKCWAGLMSPTIMASGQVIWCCTGRYRKETHLCHIDDIHTMWGSQAHKDACAAIDPINCPQCTYGPINEIVEGAIITDTWGRDFM